VDGTPYFRPPYGRHDAATDRIAVEHSYGTITLLSAEIGDSRPIDEATVLANAQAALRGGLVSLFVPELFNRGR
jgi:peptidoglycan/xylan/chitin deacetylase (PgdA/CDA1 family)